MMGLMKKRRPLYLIGIIGHSAIEASIVIILPFLIMNMINAAIAGDNELIKNGLICISFVAVAVSILFVVFGTMMYRTCNINIAQIRLNIFKHIEKLPIQYFEKNHSGDTLSRVSNDLTLMESAYASALRNIIYAVISGVGSAIAMFILDWRIGIVLILIGILSCAVNLLLSKKISVLSEKIQKKLGGLTELTLNILSGNTEIKMFSMQNIISDKIEEKNGGIYSLVISRFKCSSLVDSCNFLVSWINFCAIFAVGAFLVISGGVKLGVLAAIMELLGTVSSTFKRLGGLIGRFQYCLSGVKRVIELLEEPIEIENIKNTQNQISKEESIIQFKDVKFSYDNKSNILNKFNMNVKKEQFTALVGASGGGKSTIIKLLVRFYDNYEGEIYINGREIREYNLKELRRMIAVVPQEIHMFEGTIEENIKYGSINVSKEQVIAACKDANCHDFIMNMPDGYSTNVNEGGSNLSGGQKQRIAIARALLMDRPILILDEATSALDFESELQIKNALDKLKKGRTVLAIAHRFSTIKNADVIFVIDKGVAIEKGTNNQLIKRNGLYKRLNEFQVVKEANL